ncbi:MAG TPA: glycine--tRNA ligase subunit beta, partial [Desulfomicrobiaceae bacterium]|nr:glycine--tRNA ligase subunit beta [Desulfomicrobiaceae bacterium]
MAHFVLEIGVEEMPARFLSALEEELATRLDQALTDARLDHGLVRAAATPRRLVVEVEDVAPVQAVEDVEVLGPPAAVAWNAQGELTKAGQGFARSQSVEPHALYRVTTAKGE